MQENKDVTAIDGPVSFYLLQHRTSPLEETTLFLIGDYHDSTNWGCDPSICQKMNSDRTNLENVRKDYPCMYLGSALHVQLLYNNMRKVSTGFYLENTPFTTRYNYKDDSSWMGRIKQLLSPCSENIKDCPYYPNVQIHNVDIRQSMNGIIDILTWAGLTFEQASKSGDISDAANIVSLMNILLENFELLWKAYTLPASFALLKEIKQKILNANLGKISIEAATVIENTINDASTIRRFTGTGGVTRDERMHVAAWEMYKLFLKDAKGSTQAKKLSKFMTEEAQSVKKYLKTGIELSRLLADMSYHGANRATMHEILSTMGAKLMGRFISLGTLLMDVYTISKMLYNEDKESIIFAGSFHIERYIRFAVGYLDYIEAFGVDNTLAELEKQSEEPISRCINSDKLPLYIDFGGMKRSLIRSGELEKAEFKLKDMYLR